MGDGFPLWSLASMAWEGREPLRDWICLSVSLCFRVLSSCPFTVSYIYMEIRNSDWTEIFAVIFYQKLAFLRPKKGIGRLTGGPRGSGARPLPRAPLGHCLALVFLPKNHKYSKNDLRPFYPVWTPFDMGFLQNIKHATNRNWHWALDQYVSPKNSIKSCQNLYESCRILAWNNQKL